MNRPLTDRERVGALEAENAQLREELNAYRANERGDTRSDEDLRREVAIRRFLGMRAQPNARNVGAGPSAILLHLIDRAGHTVSREVLYGLRHDQDGNSRVIDVQVCTLRRALEAHGHPDAITSVWGRGYMLDRDVAERLRREVLEPKPLSGVTAAWT